ncbi:MAG: UDP-N-acetylglucosamine 2-epimerase (hydrolyzing) [Phycisphaerales bacterium]|nr:UDP-N-acetylglucosamine 2-epimerase (hydrolyzing) [Phycisphaerales bacterium]
MAFQPPKSDNELLAPVAKTPGKSRIAVVTGTRAEFGLLKPVITAINHEPTLEVSIIVAGSHLLAPANTHMEVRAAFRVGAVVPMQNPGEHTRIDDAEAAGRGIARFARTYYKMNADCVVVLGDRIEAFAAASAASIGGVPLAHIHGGDRAEGVADEAMRHAISKLAHIHFAATSASAERLLKMGEQPATVHNVGSPAMDGLGAMHPLNDDEVRAVGGGVDPGVVILHHPCGLADGVEQAHAQAIVEFAASTGKRVLVLAPNFDPGREAVLATLREAVATHSWHFLDHLPRDVFVGLLKRLASTNGLLLGNSSAGLIEAAAINCRAVNVGPRQSGRETPANVVSVPEPGVSAIASAVAAHRIPPNPEHPYGDGHSGPRIARLLAAINFNDPALIRKRCAY